MIISSTYFGNPLERVVNWANASTTNVLHDLSSNIFRTNFKYNDFK